jgi:hypothetical protein
VDDTTAVAPKGLEPFWLFAATSLVVGPILSYVFGVLTRLPIMYGFPALVLALVALSFAFGLWKEASGILKLGIVLWAAMLAWISPRILILVLSLQCAFLNGRAGHYVCGL